MSIPRELKYGLLAGLFIAALLSAFPVLGAVAIVFQFAVVLAFPLLAAVALAVPRTRKALFKAAEPRPVALPEAQRRPLPSPVAPLSGKNVQRLSLANGLAMAAVIVGAIAAFPLLAALGFVFQFLVIFLLFVVLLTPFLGRAFRTPESSR